MGPRWVPLPCGLSLVAVSEGYSSLQRAGFSLRWLLLQSTGSRRLSFSTYGTWAQYLWLTGSRAQSQSLWRMGLVAPWHVESSRTRARTHVPCIGRWILNHCVTREVLLLNILKIEKILFEYHRTHFFFFGVNFGCP